MSKLDIAGESVNLTHLNKIMFPEIGLTKADLIDYYIRMAPHILPYLKNRPYSMLCFPHGQSDEAFYQKKRPEGAPDYVASISIAHKEKVVDWSLVNNLPSLVYMVNRYCIEMRAWFSKVGHLNEPDVAIFDLDPPDNAGFSMAVKAALRIHEILTELKLVHFVKTSGASGLHVMVPIRPTPYEAVRAFLKLICKLLEQESPELFTTQRLIEKRKGRIYLDAVQNGRGKTLPSPYSLRATSTATVSTPVTFEELPRIAPQNFTIQNIESRLKKVGDLLEPFYTCSQALPEL